MIGSFENTQTLLRRVKGSDRSYEVELKLYFIVYHIIICIIGMYKWFTISG
jgi:hypothetical protein